MRTATIAALLVASMVLASCGDDGATEDDTTTSSSPTSSPSTPTDPGDGESVDDPDETGEPGVVRVRLEEVDGFFIEGFEIGLRFETGAGDLIDATLWSEFVTSTDNPTTDDFYGSVLEREVPAGAVVVSATVNIGIGPPPDVPDLAGELDCRLQVDVPAAGSVDIEVSFDGTTDCLRIV